MPSSGEMPYLHASSQGETKSFLVESGPSKCCSVLSALLLTTATPATTASTSNNNCSSSQFTHSAALPHPKMMVGVVQVAIIAEAVAVAIIAVAVAI